MSNQLTRRLALLGEEDHRALLGQGLRGIERETLRVEAGGQLARTPHPAALGSALTHPQITTDYAETLLEFITPAEHDIATTLHRLDTIHRFAANNLDAELLWSQSMPGPLPAEEDIAIAWYGNSHIGMLKHVYRRGLALRYGKAMQCIAGVHYNFSLADKLWPLLARDEGKEAMGAQAYQSEAYFALIRNFRRYSWLLMYLFGASPALTTSFLRGRAHTLETLSDDTLYLPYATSLRMSDLGYQNHAQAGLTPHENCLDSYVTTITHAVKQPYQAYEAIGTKRDGEWIQLNTNVLQIENEYYATIRPKRVIKTGERPVQALCRRGVQYVEVRCLDVDPFEPIGIALETGRFLDTFLLYCALEESPKIAPFESDIHAQNFARTVKQGRQPGLLLQRGNEQIELRAWAEQLMAALGPVAALLDEEHGSSVHQEALTRQLAKVADPAQTPSARVLAELAQHGNSFPAFGLAQSRLHRDYFREGKLLPVEQSVFEEMAQTSLAEQAATEAADKGSFDDFVAAYNNSTLCCE